MKVSCLGTALFASSELVLSSIWLGLFLVRILMVPM